MASGRDYGFIETLWEKITKDPITMKQNEAIIYEDVCIQTRDEKYILGGLNSEALRLIKQIESQNPDLFAGLTELPDSNFTIRTSRVTKEFAQGKGTNKAVLDKRYPTVKAHFYGIRGQYPSLANLDVRKSADAIDFIERNSHKGTAFNKYLELIAKNGIKGENVLVVGDAPNDEEMMKRVLYEGGTAGYVGYDKDLESRLIKVKSGRLIIPSQKGPVGTAQIIRDVL